MGTKGWLLAGLVALCMTTSGCQDKNLECALECGTDFDKGKDKCGEQDAACWEPFHKDYKACKAACDQKFPK